MTDSNNGEHMKISKNTPPEIASAAATMLSPYFSGLTPAILTCALETYNPNATSEKDARPPQKPMTRKAAADALGISVQSVDRLLAVGRLTRVKYSARSVRVAAESVYALMRGGGEL